MIEINDKNWKAILKGEWMIKFFGSLCGTCEKFAPIWEKLPKLTNKHNVYIAEVDVTKNPILCKKFQIPHIPTIYHAINGEFRKYDGPRDVDSILKYITEKQWKKTKPSDIKV